MSALSTLVNVALTGLFTLLKKLGKIPDAYDALAAAIIMVIAQVVVIIVANNPEISNPLTVVLNLIVAVIGALTATTSTPATLGKQVRTLFTK